MYRIVGRTGAWAALVMAAMAAGISGLASGQTQVNLQTQSKVVDFSGAAFTKPLQTGAAPPSTCTTGQMFFSTAAAAGQNVYGCVSTNLWMLESGGGGGGGTGSGFTLQSGSTTVGTRSILNISSGLGTLFTFGDTGSALTVQSSVDTAVIETLAASQGGGALYCNSSSGSGAAYTCAMTPSLTAYLTGMVLHWKPDVNDTGGGTTLSIDGLGVAAVKLADGLTDPGPNDIAAGRVQEIWYDGTVFRVLAAPLPQGALGEAQPTCAAASRGRMWFVASGTGVKDSLSVCAKDATNAYAWRTLY